MVDIPKQLQNSKFGFVVLGKWNNWGRYENVQGKSKLVETKEVKAVDYDEYHKNKEWKPLGKAPFQPGWQKKHIRFNSKELKKHEANVGVIGGFGRLRILDIDDKALGESFEEAMNTLTHKTGSGGKHFLFTSDWDKNEVLIKGLGEIRANYYQVVIPPSRHPNGEYYKVHIDKPIREISKEEFLDIVKPYLREQVQSTTLSQFEGKDTSRSGLEYGRVLALIKEGKSKEQIFEKMMAYSKWKESPDQYKELTYQKAKDYCDLLHKVEDETQELEVYSDEEISNYDAKEQKWLIENQIPEGEIGVLAGKRGERKTFTALRMALGLASGQEVFGDKVPVKRKVLFITEEDGVDTIAKRIQGLKKGMELEGTNLEIKYMCFNGLKLDRKNKKFENFKILLEEFKPDLVIIDALQRCVTFDIDKENKMISELFTETIRPLHKQFGCGWLFISHLRKSPTNAKVLDPLDEIRGGSEIVNYCRYVLSTQSPRYQTKTEEGSDLIVFKVLKMSNSQIAEPKVIAFTNECDKIKVTYEGIPEEVLAGEIQSAKGIKEWLFSTQTTEFRTKDLNDAAEEIGFKKTLLSVGLKILIKQGIVKKVKRGLYEVIGSDKSQQKLITKKTKGELTEEEIEALAGEEE